MFPKITKLVTSPGDLCYKYSLQALQLKKVWRKETDGTFLVEHADWNEIEHEHIELSESKEMRQLPMPT